MTKRNKPAGRRGAVVALIGVAILAALVLWVAQAIVAHNQLQNCIDSGRRTCMTGSDGG